MCFYVICMYVFRYVCVCAWAVSGIIHTYVHTKTGNIGFLGGKDLGDFTEFSLILFELYIINTYYLFKQHSFKDVYLFIFRQKGREEERETSVCGCFLHAPYWGPGP